MKPLIFGGRQLALGKEPRCHLKIQMLQQRKKTIGELVLRLFLSAAKDIGHRADLPERKADRFINARQSD
jgi:hypothetical protein